MTTLTIKQRLTTRLSMAIMTTLLASVLVAFGIPIQDTTKPKIKKKVLRTYSFSNNKSALTHHVEQEFNIHGQVTERSEYTTDDSGTSALQHVKLYKYDHQHHLIGVMVYDQNNILLWSEEQTWNDLDQIIKVERRTYTPEVSMVYTTFEYDDFDNITLSQTFNDANEQISERKRSYNEDGYLLHASDWSLVTNDLDNKPNKQVTQIDNEYNNRGQIDKSVLVTFDGKTRSKDVKSFQNGYMTSWTKYENGKLVSRYKHLKRDTSATEQEYLLPPPIPEQRPQLEYDDAKRDPLERIPHTPFRTTTIKTDKRGNIIKRVTREYGQVINVAYLYYNEQDQITKEKIFDKLENTTEEILYKYDEYGSLVQASTYDNNTLVLRHQYDYEYYN